MKINTKRFKNLKTIISLVIMFVICTSYNTIKQSREERLINIETNLDIIERELNSAKVMISDPKRLKQIRNNNK